MVVDKLSSSPGVKNVSSTNSTAGATASRSDSHMDGIGEQATSVRDTGAHRDALSLPEASGESIPVRESPHRRSAEGFDIFRGIFGSRRPVRPAAHAPPTPAPAPAPTSPVPSARSRSGHTFSFVLPNGQKPPIHDPLVVMAAADSGNAFMVEGLLAHGANPEGKNLNGLTALATAAAQNHLNVVKVLVDHGVDLDTKDVGGETPLMHASFYGHSKIIEFLLAKGASIDARNKDGETALMAAASEGRTEAVRVLLDRGANVSLTDQSGKTAAVQAAKAGHLETCTLLTA